MKRPSLRSSLFVLTLMLTAGSAVAAKKHAPSRANRLAVSWAPRIGSAQQAPAGPTTGTLYELCGSRDLGLVQVAAAVATRRANGQPALSTRAVQTLTRAAGVPHPWPRAWSLAGHHPPKAMRKKLQRWLAAAPTVGLRRCGIAQGSTAEGTPLVAVVTVDAVADLGEMAVKVPVAKWIRLNARLHLPASGAKVVLLGPRGRPKRVLASLGDGQVRSRFNLDQPGRWLVQVVANLPNGPRPVLEATLFAGVDPPKTVRVGESPTRSAESVGRLVELLNQQRQREGLRPLSRDRRLDSAAQKHAQAMVASGRVAHDTGHGGPQDRLMDSGYPALRIGENLARAPSFDRIHQALWASPSHRENMLDSSYGKIGVGAAKDARGQLWAVQLFAVPH